jgi:hypothetical protein
MCSLSMFMFATGLCSLISPLCFCEKQMCNPHQNKPPLPSRTYNHIRSHFALETQANAIAL